MANGKELTYLAAPYSSGGPTHQRARHSLMVEAAHWLLTEGNIFVFCPVIHCRPIALRGGLSHEFHWWEEYNTCMIGRCDTFTVLQITGWDRSTGVRNEMEIAGREKKPLFKMLYVGFKWLRMEWEKE